jgi:S1-C subfamily serine protease
MQYNVGYLSGVRSNALKHTKYPKESPWQRQHEEVEFDSRRYVVTSSKRERFRNYIYANFDIDAETKRAFLIASASVVGISFRRQKGENIVSKVGSGTIYESSEVGNGRYLSTIITCASFFSRSDADIKVKVIMAGGRKYDGNIIAFDVYYNTAIIEVLSDVALPIARLRHLDDSVSIDPALVYSGGLLEDDSCNFKISPGEKVFALARDCSTGEIMVAPGHFSADECRYDCVELLKATCFITKPGVGGPLVNRFGEVIGLSFMYTDYTPFLAVNIVEKLVNNFKRDGKFCRPLIGLSRATNLYMTDIEELARIIHYNPNVYEGVFVESVNAESPAALAGLRRGDVIVECNGIAINGFLQFCTEMLDKAGTLVKLGVIKTGHEGVVRLNIAVSERTTERKWALPYKHMQRVMRYRDGRRRSANPITYDDLKKRKCEISEKVGCNVPIIIARRL